MANKTAKPDQRQGELPTDEKANGKKKPAPIILKSPRDSALVAIALTEHATTLTKLVEKVRDAKLYSREAMVLAADAAAIEQHVLPLFRAQQELPLVTYDKLRDALAGALRIIVFRAFDKLDAVDPKTLGQACVRRRDGMLDNLAGRLAMYATELANESYNQGFAAREQSAESIAMRFAETLKPVETA